MFCFAFSLFGFPFLFLFVCVFLAFYGIFRMNFLCLPFGSALLLAQRSFGFALTIPFI
ncbi:putative membrane protein [Chlamydia psittaci 06-1683]|nr:putative membrane protein [Chlamydia psittaci 06-1683]